MKINFVLPGLGDSGGIRVVKHYTRLLNEMGVDTLIYSPLIADNLHRYNSRMLNIIHQIYSTAKTLLTMKKSEYVKWVPFISGCSVRKADYTIATTYASAFKVAKLPEECGEKWYFIQGYETWESKEYGEKSYMLPLNKIVISSWINKQLKENLGIGPFPVVFNGIDTKLFHNEGDKKDNHGLTILMMNHTNPVKGVREGLEVIRKLRNNKVDAKYVMFGMNDPTNLPEDIDYYQYPTPIKLVELYKNADIFIFPSLQDGWGLTPIEAMACGCVVVGTRTGFVLDLGENRKNMLISEPGDIDGMVANIECLVENVELRETIIKNAYETVQCLSWEQSTKELLRVLGV